MNSLILLTLSLIATAPEPIIRTAAGDGRQGYSGDGGPATSARLDQPFDTALDGRGNLYLSDTFNHCIRRVDAGTGIITTVAGCGRAGFDGDGGPATRALLHEPYGVALDARDDLYLVDRLNGRIRRVDARSGVITTVAGTGAKSYSGDGGPATAAGLVEPNGLALDPRSRHLYIADVAGHRIRRVDLESGRIETFAGTGQPRHDGDGGPAGRASIWGARAVEVGRDGTVYILEREGNRLRAVSPSSGTITTIAGTGRKGYSGDGGPAIRATFNGPKEMAVDGAGNLWIVDTENHVIRAIEARTGLIRTVAGNGMRGGSGDGGEAVLANLDRPHGVAVGTDGTLWIGDTNNQRIRKISRIAPTPAPSAR